MSRLYDPDSFDNRDPAAIERLLSKIDPVLEKFFHPQVRGLGRIPAGPALYVANHNAGLVMPDAWAVGSALYRHGGLSVLPFALAHDLAFRAQPVRDVLCPLGVVRARKDTGERILAAGHKALVFPGGDLEVLRPFKKRDEIVFGPRRGYIKLALRSGAPIIPIVTSGAHSTFVVLDDGQKLAKALHLQQIMRVNVFPTVLSFPWGLTFGFPPPHVPIPTRMYSEILAPMHFGRTGEAAAADEAYVDHCHERVVATMQTALDRLAQERREDRRHRVATKAFDLFERALTRVGLTTHTAADQPAVHEPVATSAPVLDVQAARTEKRAPVIRLSDHRRAA